MFTKKRVLFLLIFIVLGLISLQIPVSQIIGSDQRFSAFEFMGPSTGMFLSPIIGAISVIFVKVFDVLVNNKSFELTTLIRLFPMAAAALYFGTKSKKISIIPLLCIILFVVHPIGSKVWFYPMFWLIPILISFQKKRLIVNSLGATFTAHAVGSTAFLYAFNLPAEVWTGLIPVVMIERGFFALGIWAFYLATNSLLDVLVKKYDLKILNTVVNKNYTFSKKFLKQYS